jgi:hypothetical protein
VTAITVGEISRFRSQSLPAVFGMAGHEASAGGRAPHRGLEYDHSELPDAEPGGMGHFAEIIGSLAVSELTVALVPRTQEERIPFLPVGPTTATIVGL